VDELAYQAIREYEPLLADHFLDNLAHQLALQGAPPDLICRTIAERSQEYAQYREWVSADPNQMAGTLLWNSGKHVDLSVGLEQHYTFNIVFGNLFLMRMGQASIHQLLAGRGESRTRNETVVKAELTKTADKLTPEMLTLEYQRLVVRAVDNRHPEGKSDNGG
jgi:hypothetical protein